LVERVDLNALETLRISLHAGNKRTTRDSDHSLALAATQK
jgi:hypothetical protein